MTTTPTRTLLALVLCLVGGLPRPGHSFSSSSLTEPFNSFDRLSHIPCVSLFYRNGRTGCSTLSKSAQGGRIVHWSAVVSGDNADDNYSANVGRLPPYVVLMDENEFTADNVAMVQSFAETASLQGAGSTDGDKNDNDEEGFGVLRGILVINATAGANPDSVSYYSPAPQSPQGEGSPSEKIAVGGTYPWNPNGDGHINVDYYGLPVAYVGSEPVAADLYNTSIDQAKVLEQILAGENVGDDDLYPAIVSEFKYYMGQADMNSEACLRWKDLDGEWNPKCQPLGGASVWATAGSPEVRSTRRRAEDANDGKRPVVLMATSIDATNMFHGDVDASFGANTAATNILSLLMAAKLLGSSVTDETLDGFSNRIIFGFFQAESYGYIGSRRFLRDVAYPGFQCDEGRSVPAISKNADAGSKMGCLNPLRTDLDFQELGNIAGMIAVDQVGVLASQQTFYVHGAESEDDGGFYANVLAQLSSDSWTVEASSAEADDNGGTPIPPSPLQSLVALSEGAVGGAVLAGYDDAFVDESRYHSNLDSNTTRSINMDAVAMAATVLARAAIASAYDGGNGDAENAAQYAVNIVPELKADDQTLLDLANCLLVDGNCDVFLKFAGTESQTTDDATGVSLGIGTLLGTPPTYYPSVYNYYNSQGFVYLGQELYGAYAGDKEYGAKDSDTFLIQPTVLEMSISGLLNDFLGRGSSSSDGTVPEPTQCKKTKDCANVSYCLSTGDEAVCTGGGVCVCTRAHYHLALDEALAPVAGNMTGFFEFDEDDEGATPVFTEPNWSSSVAVRVYQDAGSRPGDWALGVGVVVAAVFVASTYLLKRRLKKEKLY